jgi:altronate dehydratase small subunit
VKVDALMIKSEDNVATALHDLKCDDVATIGLGESQENVRMVEDIPYGHKFAVVDIKKGDSIIKYGEVIGRATESIEQGAHAHVQNIESLRGRGDLG